jgi:hypothetical protein
MTEYEKNIRPVKVDLKELYRQHLVCMSRLNDFKSLQLNWDHSFYKNILDSNIEKETLRFP